MSDPSTPTSPEPESPDTAPVETAPVETERVETERPQPARAEPVRYEAQPAEAPRSRYSLGTMPNMLRSMFVIGLFVLALVAIVPRVDQVDRPAVDAAGKARATASQTGWPLELPTGLGTGWKPTVATYAPGTGQVATFTTVWATPAGEDIALKQALAPSPEWLTRSVAGGQPAGSVTIGGRAFTRYRSDDGRQVSLVVRSSGAKPLTIVATGTASESEMAAFVAALRPVAAG